MFIQSNHQLAYCCEHVVNMSDHSPLCLCLNIDSKKF